MIKKIVIFLTYVLLSYIYVQTQRSSDVFRLVHLVWVGRILVLYTTGVVIYHFVEAFKNEHRRLKEGEKNESGAANAAENE